MKLLKSLLVNLTPKYKVIFAITCCSCLYIFINAVVRLIRYPLTYDDKVYYIVSVIASSLAIFHLYHQTRDFNLKMAELRMERIEQLKEAKRMLEEKKRLLEERLALEAQTQEPGE